MSAGEALLAAALDALAGVPGLGAYDGSPIQAVSPYAVVEIGPEADWGHKSGAGRELRMATILRDEGERPGRLRQLMAACEAALLGVPAELDGWRVASLALVRSRTSRERNGGWIGLVEIRARMLAQEG